MQYLVLTPLDHDNQKYAPGSTVELDEATAAHLIEGEVVRDPNSPVNVPKDDLSTRVHNAKNGIEPKADAVTSVEAPVNTPSADAPVVEDLEKMGRDALRDLAIKEGIAEGEVNGLMTSKAFIRDLIVKNRDAKAAAATQPAGGAADTNAPVNDPSAGL